MKKCRKKKYHVLKKMRKKEKSGDSFRDIVRKKNCQWWELCIKQRMLQKRGEVFASGLRRIGEWSRHEQCLMIACAMSARIRELATLWDVLLEVCEDHEKMWCGATWKNAVWSRGVGVNLTYTWSEESGKLDGIWDETTIDFLNFLDQWIEKKPSMSDVAIRCELWRSSIMIGMKDEKEIKFKRECWNINLILVLKLNKLGNKGRLFSFSTLAEF
jgi:hypothetical protein